MSNSINTVIIEEARQFQEDFIGTYMAKALEDDIENNDLESLQAHLVECRATGFDINYNPDEATDVN